MKILITYNVYSTAFDEVISKHEVTLPTNATFTRQEILNLLPHYDAVSTLPSMPVDKEFIDAGKNLKLIANHAVGYNNIDIPYALSKGIAVTNTPHSVTIPTANLALGLLIDAARRISEFDRRYRKEGREMKRNFFKNYGLPLDNKQLGIIGLGRIGKALAKRAYACDMQIVYNNRNRLSKQEEEALNVKYLPLEQLLTTSDFISINAPYNQSTHHLISHNELNMMKPTTILINTSRGPLIDELALINALKQKTIYAAGLDVFEFDDRPLKELLELDNVVVTPHIGTQTDKGRLDQATEVNDNLIGFFDKDREISLVYE